MLTRLAVRALPLAVVLWPILAFAGPSDALKLPGEPAMPTAAKMAGTPAATGGPMTAPAGPMTANSGPMTDAQKYCQNIAVAAADARFAWQTKRIAELDGQIKQRVDDLEVKQASYKEVLARYDDAMKRAKATVLDIYANMKPETAALQLSALDDATAAAILSQLNARKASAILNEIDATRAVKLVNTMSGLVPPADKKP